MYVNGCICERTAAIWIHRVGADVACGAGNTVGDDGIRIGEIPRSIECNHSHSSIRNVIPTFHRMAGSAGSGEDNPIVTRQGRNTASVLGMNSSSAKLPTSNDKDQGCGGSQGQQRTDDSFIVVLLNLNFPMGYDLGKCSVGASHRSGERCSNPSVQKFCSRTQRLSRWIWRQVEVLLEAQVRELDNLEGSVVVRGVKLVAALDNLKPKLDLA